MNSELNNILQLIAIGLLGIAAQISIKISMLRRRTKDTSIQDISLKRYLHDEWDIIAGSVLALVIAGVLYNQSISSLPETVGHYVVSYNRALFITIGYSGQSLLSSWLGSSDKRINKEIKDLLDDKTPDKE